MQPSKPARRKNRNDHSLDDFIKHIRRYNLRSERYLSPSSPFYIYNQLKNPYNQTYHTLDKSRTNSNRHSNSKKKTSSLLKTVRRILKDDETAKRIHTQGEAIIDPATQIQAYDHQLRKIEKAIQGRSKVGSLLCQTFLRMLNDIIDNIANYLQRNLDAIEQKILQNIEEEMEFQKEEMRRQQNEIEKMQKYIAKVQCRFKESLEKANANSKLIDHLRKVSQGTFGTNTNPINIDMEFSTHILGVPPPREYGYRQENDQFQFVEFRDAGRLKEDDINRIVRQSL